MLIITCVVRYEPVEIITGFKGLMLCNFVLHGIDLFLYGALGYFISVE